MEMEFDRDSQQVLRELLAEEGQEDPLSRLLHRYGVDFEPAHRPDRIPEGVKKYCFRNSLRLATENPSLEYVEGVVIPSTVERCAQRHAWCVDRGGRVIDSTPTWADPGRPLPNAMIGIALPLELARPYVECEEPTRGALSALSERLEVVTDALGLKRID